MNVEIFYLVAFSLWPCKLLFLSCCFALTSSTLNLPTFCIWTSSFHSMLVDFLLFFSFSSLIPFKKLTLVLFFSPLCVSSAAGVLLVPLCLPSTRALLLQLSAYDSPASDELPSSQSMSLSSSSSVKPVPCVNSGPSSFHSSSGSAQQVSVRRGACFIVVLRQAQTVVIEGF